MRWILFGFIVLLLSALCGIQLQQDPGRVFISIHHWTIETTLWVGILLIIFSFVIIHVLFNFFKVLAFIPSQIHHWRQQRKIYQAQVMTRKGLIEFSEGYWSLAQKHLIRALPFTDTPLINYLTAARAAQELGENQRRDDFLREAKQSMPDTKIAIELTQAQLQLAHQQWEQALATLKHLQTFAPQHPHVLKLLLALYEQIKDWQQLIVLLPLVKKASILSEPEYQKIRVKAYTQALQDLIKANHHEALTLFQEKLPADLRYHPEITALYASHLIAEQELMKAERLLRRCLKKQFSETLVNLYGQFFIHAEQLQFAEQLIKKQPDSAMLYLSLGRICLKSQLWGKAETYLQKSISLKPTCDAYTELGHYFSHFNYLDKACAAYKEALLLT